MLSKFRKTFWNKQEEKYDEEFNRIYNKFHDWVNQNFTVDNIIGEDGEFKNLAKYIQALEIDRSTTKEVSAEKDRKMRENHKNDMAMYFYY